MCALRLKAPLLLCAALLCVLAGLAPQHAAAQKRGARAAAQTTTATRAAEQQLAPRPSRLPAVRDRTGTTTLRRASKPYRPRLTLNEYLAQQLGGKYHLRREWAGRREGFTPIESGARVWEPIGRVEYLTIHHAEGVPDEHPARMIRNIFVGHTDSDGRLGAADVGYHFFVDRQGEVWKGRDARRRGTHVGSRPKGLNNDGNLGVCGLGTYTDEAPPRRMVEGIAQLAVLIARYYDRPLTIRGHRQWVGIRGYRPEGGNDCPGRLMTAVFRARERVQALGLKAAPEVTPRKTKPPAKATPQPGKPRRATAPLRKPRP